MPTPVSDRKSKMRTKRESDRIRRIVDGKGIGLPSWPRDAAAASEGLANMPSKR